MFKKFKVCSCVSFASKVCETSEFPIPQVTAVKVRSHVFQKVKLTVTFKYIILIYDVYNCVSESVGARCYVLQCEFFCVL